MITQEEAKVLKDKMDKIKAFVAVESTMNIPLKEGTWVNEDEQNTGKLQLLSELKKIL